MDGRFELLTFGMGVQCINHYTTAPLEVDYMCLTVTALAVTALCLGLKTQKSSPQTKQPPAKTMSYYTKLR